MLKCIIIFKWGTSLIISSKMFLQTNDFTLVHYLYHLNFNSQLPKLHKSIWKQFDFIMHGKKSINFFFFKFINFGISSIFQERAILPLKKLMSLKEKRWEKWTDNKLNFHIWIGQLVTAKHFGLKLAETFIIPLEKNK